MNNFTAHVSANRPSSQLRGEPGSTTTVARFEAFLPPTGERDEGGPIDCVAYGAVADALLTPPFPGGWVVVSGNLKIPKAAKNEQALPPELTASKVWPAVPLGDPSEVTDALNIITLVGRAGLDPEVRYFESGGCVANLRMAVNRRSRDDEPDWFNLAIWGKQAQVAADYVRKGSLLAVVGSLKFDSWTDRASGEERRRPVVLVSRLDLLGSKRDQENAGGEAPRTWGGKTPAFRQGPPAQAPTAGGGMW
jgi:single-strand DNA-binding protein